MQKLKEFLKLNFKEKSLFMLIYILLVIISLVIKMFSFELILKVLKKENLNIKKQMSAEGEETIKNISRFVIASANHIPWNVKCLAQAVVGKILLNYYNIPSKLFLGVKKEEEGKSIEAHAWLKVNDLIVTGHGMESFNEIASFQ